MTGGAAIERLKKSRYVGGATNRVNWDANSRPPTINVAIGSNNAPPLKAMGTSPKTVVSDVSITVVTRFWRRSRWHRPSRVFLFRYRLDQSVKKRNHNVGNILRCDTMLAGFVLHDVDHDLDGFVTLIVFVAHKVRHHGQSGPMTPISTMPDSLPPTGSLVSRARGREIFSQILPRSYLHNHSIFGACRVHDKNALAGSASVGSRPR
jgi:hypothetical protein